MFFSINFGFYNLVLFLFYVDSSSFLFILFCEVSLNCINNGKKIINLTTPDKRWCINVIQDNGLDDFSTIDFNIVDHELV